MKDYTQIPGMTPQKECVYLAELSSKIFDGTAVEVGTYLGMSACAILDGLGGSSHLYCFDRFQWKITLHEKKHPMGLANNADTTSIVRYILREYLGRYTLNKTDICDISWNRGAIDLLYLDAPKKYRELQEVFAAFGPSLKEGSYLVMQDFLWPPSFEIPIFMKELCDLTGPPTWISDSGSGVAFRMRDAINELPDMEKICLDGRRLGEIFGLWSKAVEGFGETSKARRLLQETSQLIEEKYSGG